MSSNIPALSFSLLLSLLYLFKLSLHYYVYNYAIVLLLIAMSAGEIHMHSFQDQSIKIAEGRQLNSKIRLIIDFSIIFCLRLSS